MKYIYKILFVFSVLFFAKFDARSQTYGTDISSLYLMDFTQGACFSIYIGDFFNPNNGLNISMGDIALCPDGVLYGIGGGGGAGGLFIINPTNAIVTEVMTVTGGYNALGCSPNFRMIGVGNDVVEFFIGSMTSTVLGSTGQVSAGDIVFFQGKWYHTTTAGLMEIPNIDNPDINQIIYAGPPYAGITVSPNNCNSLILPDFEYMEYNIASGSITQICNIGYSGGAGLTSMVEFQPPIGCELVLDLDDDDSTGSPDFNYRSEDYTCINSDGIHIADEDVYINAVGDIKDISINIDVGNLDSPDEILILNSANNINISGSGTSQIVLSNAGVAQFEDFEMALSDMIYVNLKSYPTPGLRTIKVVMEDLIGNISNDAFGFINVIEFIDVSVDLGPDLIRCAGDLAILNGGVGDTYLWSTSEITQTIKPSTSGEYFVTITEGIKCPNYDSVQLVFLPNYFISLTVEGEVCLGEDVVIEIYSEYKEFFDIEIRDINTNTFILFENVLDGDIIHYPVTGTTFLQINEIIPSTLDACLKEGNGFIEVIVNQMITDSTIANICLGDSIFFRGAYLDTMGIYIDTVESFQSCDSLFVLDLLVYPSFLDTISGYTCDGNQVGTFLDTLKTFYGCDSFILNVVSLVTRSDTIIETTSCDVNLVIDTFIVMTNMYGCDSVIHKIITYSQSDTTFMETFTCNPLLVGVNTIKYVTDIGCDSIVINQTNLLRSDTLLLETFTCDSTIIGDTLRVKQNQFGCDSLVFESIKYLKSKENFIKELTCNLASAGIIYDTLSTSEGCDSINIFEYIYLPPDTVFINNISCDSLKEGVKLISFKNSFGCDSVIQMIQTAYAPLDTIGITTYSCNLAKAGLKFEYYQTQTGCDSIVSINTIYSPIDTVFQYQLTCQIDSVGQFLYKIVTAEGCDSIIAKIYDYVPLDTLFIETSTCDPSLVNIKDTMSYDYLGCDSIIVNSMVFVGSDTTWIDAMTCNENIAGIDYMTLSNKAGCDSIVVRNNILMPSQNVIVYDSVCVLPFDSLEVMMLVNQFGCDSIVSIQRSYYEVFLDLGLDRSIELGQEVVINVNTNIINGIYQWTSEPFLEESDFDDLIIVPIESMVVSLQITSSNGCIVNDQFLIEVNLDNEIILPNIFSPNGDGVNDIFTFDFRNYEIESVSFLNIFDRWGNLVYSIQDVSESSEISWGGKMDGTEVQQGVFIIDVLFKTRKGELVRYTQDITLIR